MPHGRTAANIATTKTDQKTGLIRFEQFIVTHRYSPQFFSLVKSEILSLLMWHALFLLFEQKSERRGSDLGLERKRAQIIGDPIRSGGQELFVRRSRAQSEHARAGGFARANSRGGVFGYNAIRRGNSKNLCAFQIGVGEGLAAQEFTGGDQMFRNQQ